VTLTLIPLEIHLFKQNINDTDPFNLFLAVSLFSCWEKITVDLEME
jgi:hypothetical protein